MGKSLPSVTKLQEFTRIISSDGLKSSRQRVPISRNWISTSEPAKSGGVRVDSGLVKQKKMEAERSEKGQQSRLPLAQVVSECVKRWFQDTLKEAKAGDSNMQVLVGQMYYSGYGVPRDAQKGRAWISRASKSRLLLCQVSDKHPGYNPSDSDSDELKGDSK